MEKLINMTKKLTDHDLLIRIDERQVSISRKITDLCDILKFKVNNDEEYKEMVRKVDNLWDSKNKMIGWMVGAGASGGLISTLIKNLVEGVFAKW